MRGSILAKSVAVACSLGLLLSTACSQPGETQRSEVLATDAAATPEAARQTARLNSDPLPSPSPTPPELPTAGSPEKPQAPPPAGPSAPGVEAAPAQEPVNVPPPGPGEAAVSDPAAAAGEAPAPPPPIVNRSASVVDRVTQLINAARGDQGLAPLSPSAALMEAAQREARAIAESGSLSHTPPNGSPMVSRVQAAGYYGWVALAEVLAAGPASPEEVVALWLSSPEHRDHLLDPTLKELGVGYFYAGGSAFGHWWAVDLGAR